MIKRIALGCAVVAVVAGLVLWYRTTLTGDKDAVVAGSDHYTVRLVDPKPKSGPWQVEITDRDGKPATLDEVVLEPAMARMGHATDPVTATFKSPGHYQAKGLELSMPGQWSITVRLRHGSDQDEVVVPVQVAG
ncbi:FixH family protein [Kribbella solani]|uniref:YtkA-like domain-containing protein n=1 Tax=Kribbella solani TaxID=236067 RepID=A0A841DXW7_9ACTN|nr:FixH family protein [Kribbella solani]MBB5980078.1 hypothetical protein [Kribbella solani]